MNFFNVYRFHKMKLKGLKVFVWKLNRSKSDQLALKKYLTCIENWCSALKAGHSW
jgi:hypothetical protein